MGLLFLNIEAAQAGLITRLRLYIDAEFSVTTAVIACLLCLCAAFFIYVVVSPVHIHGGTSSLRGLPGSMTAFGEKKQAVRRIADKLAKSSAKKSVARREALQEAA